MIEQDIENHERFRQQYQSELEAAEAELKALLPDGQTTKISTAQAKVNALGMSLVFPVRPTQAEHRRTPPNQCE